MKKFFGALMLVLPIVGLYGVIAAKSGVLVASSIFAATIIFFTWIAIAIRLLASE